MSETFLMRFTGGPLDGETLAPIEGMTSDSGLLDGPLHWPLPDRFGQYRKRSESQLPPQPEGSPLIRGAEYEWVEEEATA